VGRWTFVASGRTRSLSRSDRYSRRASASADRSAPAEASRSGRPTSPTNKVSPVSTPCGAEASGCSHTTTQIDSGVWPGVARISRVTSPSDSRCPSCKGSMGKPTSAPAT
jgi:hypothetical protein